MSRRRTSSPSPSTLRTRRLREREKAGRGQFYYLQEFDNLVVELLIGHGMIDADVSENHKSLSETVYRFVVETLQSQRDA
ncbi:MAG: hypothetical protein NXI07_13310, partial [bacterium]|nr:hypothetical protein [bacterium]